MVLVLFGGAANLIEYTFFVGINDWLKIPFWPAFNLWDTIIALGIFVLIAKSLRHP